VAIPILKDILNDLRQVMHPIRKDNFVAARKMIRNVCGDCKKRESLKDDLQAWLKRNREDSFKRYNTYLYNQHSTSVLNVKPVPPVYSENSPEVPGREILRDNYDVQFSRNPRLLTFGEDAGRIGGVNQSFEGLQKKYGELRITDTGIREATILGQGIGLALRGLRPIAEIQYLDYLLYALQGLSDDVATTHYRTAGNMIVPLIVSTRGHRLEGIWHSGSPIGMLINSVRGMYVCVPRDMTRASGFYNTLLEGEDRVATRAGWQGIDDDPLDLLDLALGLTRLGRLGSESVGKRLVLGDLFLLACDLALFALPLGNFGQIVNRADLNHPTVPGLQPGGAT